MRRREGVGARGGRERGEARPRARSDDQKRRPPLDARARQKRPRGRGRGRGRGGERRRADRARAAASRSRGAVRTRTASAVRVAPRARVPGVALTPRAAACCSNRSKGRGEYVRGWIAERRGGPGRRGRGRGGGRVLTARETTYGCDRGERRHWPTAGACGVSCDACVRGRAGGREEASGAIANAVPPTVGPVVVSPRRAMGLFRDGWARASDAEREGRDAREARAGRSRGGGRGAGARTRGDAPCRIERSR